MDLVFSSMPFVGFSLAYPASSSTVVRATVKGTYAFQTDQGVYSGFFLCGDSVFDDDFLFSACALPMAGTVV